MVFWMQGFKGGTLDPKGRALWWVSVPLILLSLMKSLFGRVEANWPIMAYIGILPLVSERFFWGDEKKKRWLRHIALGWAIAAAVIVHLHLLATVIPLPADREPTSQLRKWSETAELAGELAHQCDGRSSPGIHIIRYQVAAELYYYLGDDIRIIMDQDHARPNVFQFYTEFADPDRLKKQETTLKGRHPSGFRPILLLDTMPFTDLLLNSFGIDKTRVQQHEIMNEHGEVIRRMYSFCLTEDM
jgi:hypothetical protein